MGKASRFTSRRRLQAWAVCLVLAALTFAVFAPVAGHRFLGYDDDLIVTQNPRVAGGWSAENARWALTSFSGSNWNPVTRFSHMLDVELFGLDAGRHHAVNLLLHAANVLLLHGVLSAYTGARWRSALVAALFAIHPLHVESVAWVAERKDVLSTLFGLLALGAYLRHVRRPGRGRLAMVSGFLALGLMAKPMLVTLPFVLLLLDWWPLGRVRGAPAPGGAARAKSLFPLLREKTPLLLLAAASSYVTVIAQSRGGAMTSMEVFPVGARIANALVAYGAYLGKFVWPVDLAVIYPVRLAWGWQATVGAAALLAALTALALANAKRRPYLLAGWLWYCGILVPVSGLVQVGLQAMADRYTYLPLVGIFVAFAWAAAEVAARARAGRTMIPALCVAALAALALLARAQVGFWKDDVSLFRHAVSVTAENHVAMNNLGVHLAGRGEVEQGLAQLRAAVRVRPGDSKSWTNLGMVLASNGRAVEAETVLRSAVRFRPDFAAARNNLGIALAMQGRVAEAREEFLVALRLQPDYADARSNLAHAFELQGQLEQARDAYRAALADNPRQGQAHRGLARVLQRLGSGEEASRHAQEAARLVRESGGGR